MTKILLKLLIFPLATKQNILISDIDRHRRWYLKTKMSISYCGTSFRTSLQYTEADYPICGSKPKGSLSKTI